MNSPAFSPSIHASALCALAFATFHPGGALAAGPSFDCAKVPPGSVEATICADQELPALDRKLADVYAQATEKAANEHPPRLKAEQRGWIKGCNDCWKNDDQVSLMIQQPSVGYFFYPIILHYPCIVFCAAVINYCLLFAAAAERLA